tara:strand:+ start:5114 stop:5350 length:237 start_codon:yes stop_codon:yes gene_type:complete
MHESGSGTIVTQHAPFKNEGQLSKRASCALTQALRYALIASMRTMNALPTIEIGAPCIQLFSRNKLWAIVAYPTIVVT